MFFFINNKIPALYFTLIFKRRLFLTSRIFVYKTYNLVYVGSEDNILLPMQYWSSHHGTSSPGTQFDLTAANKKIIFSKFVSVYVQ